ncbi:MAG TPA: Hsp20/alpha crystallin family protein [Halanaerobiales bacterium]|nr:Hsp20/alpha crystallin family protein [Halanaerobiales bacterium]
MFDLVPFRNRRRGEVEEGKGDPFNSLVNEFFSDAFNAIDTKSFKTDVKETDENYIIESELPGLSKEDINIEITDNYLTISAQNEEKFEEEKENYIRRERRTGSFQRVFQIDNVKEDEIDAKYENGILEVTLPKKEKQTPKKKTIDIK